MTEIINYKFIEKLQQLPYIEAIYLYGSRARGDNQPRSDIDIAIDAPFATQNDWVDVMTIIENADTLLKIDCVWLNDLKENDPLRINIEQDKKTLFRRK